MEGLSLKEENIFDSEGKDLGHLFKFLKKHLDIKNLINELMEVLTQYHDVYHSTEDKEEIKDLIKTFSLKWFSKKMSESFSLDDLEEACDDLFDLFEKYSSETEKVIKNHVKSIFLEPKTGGDTMFKNLKEAKMFTAHLDSLANEIQGLEDVSSEMRQHLAYRLDKLSDMIETTAAKKEASEKQANGMGHGAWQADKDEDYMETFGGTGALEHDKDEPYMSEFAGADHMEVLKRKEPAKVKEAALSDYVKKAMSKLK